VLGTHARFGRVPEMTRSGTERDLLLVALLACGGCAEDREGSGLDAGPDASYMDGGTAPLDAVVDGDAGPADAGASMDAASARDARATGDDDDAGSDPDGVARLMLVDHYQWRALEKSWDPFEDRPVDVRCDPAGLGFGVEELSDELAFHVRTRLCAYITAEQPSLHEVRAGDLVKVRLWYFQLTSPQPTEAHVAVQLGDELLIDERIPIPTDSGGLLTARWTASETLPAGMPVRVHVHNHGANEYGLIEVSTGPAE